MPGNLPRGTLCQTGVRGPSRSEPSLLGQGEVDDGGKTTGTARVRSEEKGVARVGLRNWSRLLLRIHHASPAWKGEASLKAPSTARKAQCYAFETDLQTRENDASLACMEMRSPCKRSSVRPDWLIIRRNSPSQRKQGHILTRLLRCRCK